MTKVEEALVEVKAELKRIEPIHEGLRDYAMLDITPETRTQVNAAIYAYDYRVALLTNVEKTLEALLAGGYPELEIPPVEAAVLQDLEMNQKTITAALRQFTVDEAVSLEVIPGIPEDKPEGDRQ
jgi:hypothetical protein